MNPGTLTSPLLPGVKAVRSLGLVGGYLLYLVLLFRGLRAESVGVAEVFPIAAVYVGDGTWWPWTDLYCAWVQSVDRMCTALPIAVPPPPLLLVLAVRISHTFSHSLARSLNVSDCSFSFACADIFVALVTSVLVKALCPGIV